MGDKKRGRTDEIRYTAEVMLPIAVPQYAGRKQWFLPYAEKFFRAHRCTTLIEPFAGSAIVGLSLLNSAIVERLVLVEKDERIACLLKGLVQDPELADRYATFKCTEITSRNCCEPSKAHSDFWSKVGAATVADSMGDCTGRSTPTGAAS